MRPVHTPQTNVNLGRSGYADLPAQRCHAVITDERGGQEPGIAPAIRSVWEVTAEERACIANGADIELIVLGTAQPPVLLKTTADPESAVWEDRESFPEAGA